MTNRQRKEIGIQAFSNRSTITNIANQNNTSRKFIYNQKNKIADAANEAFEEKDANEKILFNLPVTKTWLEQLVLCLLLHCRGSFRNIQQVIEDCFDYSIALGTVHNISDRAKTSAGVINSNQNLSPVKLAAHDEIFHHNKPTLVGVDIHSLYCYLLTEEDHRDEETWAIRLLELQDQGFNPDRIIGDDGSGMRSAHKSILPNTPFDYDNFHLSKLMMETRRYFRNCYKTSVTEALDMKDKLRKMTFNEISSPYISTLAELEEREVTMKYLSNTMDTLVSWMQHDVLNKAGKNPQERRGLYDFIVREFSKLEKIHPHRIGKMCVTLKAKRDQSLAYCDVLNEKFRTISKSHQCSLEFVWRICELLRCEIGGDTYAIRSIPLEDSRGDQFDEIEDEVIAALCSTERTSSMVENFNSRLRVSFHMRREIGHGYLGLLQFFLNHKPFLRSSKGHRVGKTPVEILNGKTHPHWLELLGYTQFKRAA